jgi:hypothetical protein
MTIGGCWHAPPRSIRQVWGHGVGKGRISQLAQGSGSIEGPERKDDMHTEGTAYNQEIEPRKGPLVPCFLCA